MISKHNSSDTASFVFSNHPVSRYKLLFYLSVQFILACVFSITASAQTITNSSPYSRYGIGDLSGKGFSQGFAMGGTNIAMQNDTTAMFFINSGNPASYSNIRLTTAEIGANFNRVNLESSDAKQAVNNASLAYFALAFPFKKWWVGSIGLVPYSSVGFKVTDHQDIENIGGVDFLYQGSGGINQVYFGNGIKPLYGLARRFMKSSRYEKLKEEKNYAKANRILKRKKSLESLSLGVNTSYMFGSFNNSRRAIFPYGSNYFNLNSITSTRVSDVYFDYGAQFSHTFDSVGHRELRDKVTLLLGATFSAQSNISAKIDSTSYTYFNNSLGYEIPKDTIQNLETAKGKIRFPMSFGFGLGIKKGDRWLVSADFAVQNWSNYAVFDQTQGLKNSMRVSLGGQYVPNSKANGKGTYYKRIHYRIGGRYAETMIELQNTQLTEYAFSVGAGFPLGRNFLMQNFSMVNIGFEAGQRGTITNGLIKEQFFKATLGFTINDRWFVKPKFD